MQVHALIRPRSTEASAPQVLSFVKQLVQMRVDHSTTIICYATCADGQAVELRVQRQITTATKLFRPITDHGMHG